MSTAEMLAVALVMVALIVAAAMFARRAAGRPTPRRPIHEDTFRLAADQLAGDDVALRLPAITALEELAQTHPRYRQGVIDLLCGYLRRTPDQHDDIVRGAAQQTLTAHLRPASVASYWGERDLDLDDATIHGLDLSGAVVGTLSGRHARFTGTTRINGARLLGPAMFTGAYFCGTVEAADVDFDEQANFECARFGGRTSFTRSVFRSDVTFAAATFAGHGDFSATIFLAMAVFGDPAGDAARFDAAAAFRGAAFTAARFDRVEFTHSADFSEARFIEHPGLMARRAGHRPRPVGRFTA